MRRLLVSAVGVLSTAFACTSAFAADLPIKPRAVAQPAPAAQASNWSGGQVGGNAGGSVGNNNFVDPGSLVCNGPGCTETPFSFNTQPGSFLGGLFLGYRWQMGNTVFGLEGDVTFQDLNSSATQSACCNGGAGGGTRAESFSGSVNQRTESSIRARYGWLWSPNTLLYGTAGIAFGDVSGNFGYTGISSGGTTVAGSASWSDTLVGWTIGAGVESNVSSMFGVRGLKARAEYRFTDYGSFTKNVPLGCSGLCTPVTAPSNNAQINVSDVYNHKFMVGLGLDF